jgi:hypothetical protein
MDQDLLSHVWASYFGEKPPGTRRMLVDQQQQRRATAAVAPLSEEKERREEEKEAGGVTPSGKLTWQCVKTSYPFCSHQNSW